MKLPTILLCSIIIQVKCAFPSLSEFKTYQNESLPIPREAIHIPKLRPLNEIVIVSNAISDDDLKTIDDVFNVMNGILDVGASIKPLEEIFGPLAALGKLILSFFHLGQQSDPVMEKLKEISRQIEKLGDQMNQQFAELKSYITEVNFDTQILEPCFTLHQFMQDTIAYPGKESIENFYREYQKNAPIFIGYNLVTLLEMIHTNPLMKSMDADPRKKAETFEKWSQIYNNTMLQIIVIETYANGMFGNSTLYGTNRLTEKMQNLNKTISVWKTQYQDSYWPSYVERLVHDVQNADPHGSYSDKANSIKEGIEQMLKADGYSYFVIVYDGVNKWRYQGDHGSNYITDFRQDVCNLVVMRTSKTSNSDVDRAVSLRTILGKHVEEDDWRCKDMIDELHTYNPTSTADLFIIRGHPVILKIGTPGAWAEWFKTYWISTY